jgi:ATP-dependent DNA helicase PIF1
VREVSVDEAVDEIARGKQHVYVSGPAGYGKSRFVKVHVLRRLENAVKNVGGVGVTAMTRVAAKKLGGRTFQSWAGVGFGEGSVEQLVRKMSAAAVARVCKTEVLIVDEVSLMNAQMLDKVDRVVREVRQNSSVFGGIKLIIVGDFCQLEPFPVYTRDEVQGNNWRVRVEEGRFVFQSDVWKHGKFVCYRLLVCHRYGADGGLGQMLGKCRLVRRMPKELFEDFRARMEDCTNVPSPSVNTHYVVNTKDIAAQTCEWCLSKLDGDEHEFWAVDRTWQQGRGKPPIVQYCSENGGGGAASQVVWSGNKPKDIMGRCRGEKRVVLKKKTKVVAVGPVNKDVPNGSFGEVTGFVEVHRVGPEKGHDWEVYKELGICDAAAQEGWKHVGCKRDRKILWPRVLFQVRGKSVTVVVEPKMMVLRDWNGKFLAARYQLPIVAGYAVTVHRVQGMDLEEVVYDISGVFANGQVYTGCSRTSELGKLFITGTLTTGCKMQHPDVLDFMEKQEWIGIKNVREVDVEWEGRDEEDGSSDDEENFNWFSG